MNLWVSDVHYGEVTRSDLVHYVALKRTDVFPANCSIDQMFEDRIVDLLTILKTALKMLNSTLEYITWNVVACSSNSIFHIISCGWSILIDYVFEIAPRIKIERC